MARILLTAGPTRAYIDDVRFLTNASSGRMAAAIAQAALAAGHQVTIVSGPVQLRYPTAARVIPVITTREMLDASLAELPSVQGVVAAAAPCDFEPVRRVAGKIPRQGDGLSLKLAPTPDVIATLARKSGPRQWFVAFALEPGADPRRAFQKIEAKRCDLIVVNDVTAIEGTRTAVTVYDRSHAAVGSKAGTKRAVATWLIRLLATRLMS
ncbi:MAG: phosphopantothenoylcysteine decarboxylase [Planctomycetota bacterium]|jgi:phosphopantothenoylcysteine decarboxylase/phosphopantothenate--cysteine ligase